MMDEEVRKAGSHILAGGTILYPTDTIWGLGCDALNRDAVDRIYRIKQRLDHKSMLVLMDSPSMLEEYLERVPEPALEIIRSAVKPTTVIYPGAKKFAPNLLAPDGSIGIRITSDPFCRQLIKLLCRPIVSTSANISGHGSPANFSEIEATIKEQVDHVVNWRRQEINLSPPSTIIKVDPQGGITVLRP